MDTRNDPVRDKYCHATTWDYTTRTPELERLRHNLATEYDQAQGIRLPASPDDPEAFTMLLRHITRTVLNGLEAQHLIRSADTSFRIMFPYPDQPNIGDQILLDAVIDGFAWANDPHKVDKA